MEHQYDHTKRSEKHIELAEEHMKAQRGLNTKFTEENKIFSERFEKIAGQNKEFTKEITKVSSEVDRVTEDIERVTEDIERFAA